MPSNRTKLFLDTEFTGLHQGASLISLALVSELGPSFYAELTDYDSDQLTDWHRENVLPNLILDTDTLPYHQDDSQFFRGDRSVVRDRLTGWLSSLGEVEIWADVLAWDWVLFCELFGGSFGLPSNVFYIPFDLSTLFYLKGNPDVSREAYAFPDAASRKAAEALWGRATSLKHNALWDAHVSRLCFDRLKIVLPLI